MRKQGEASAPGLLNAASTALLLSMHGVRVVEFCPCSRCLPSGSHLKQEGSL